MIAVGLHESHTGNAVIDFFIKGGPVMWPILMTSIVAVTVVLERSFWWLRQNSLRESSKLEKVFEAIENGNLKDASTLSRAPRRTRVCAPSGTVSIIRIPRCKARCRWRRASSCSAPAASWRVMDTTITLAPLLGLLGTVTGIMGAFNAVGVNGLDPATVSGGIGEALIATACGLGIAMTVPDFLQLLQHQGGEAEVRVGDRLDEPGSDDRKPQPRQTCT